MGFIFSITIFAYIVIVCIPCAFLAFVAFKKRTDEDHFWILSGITLTVLEIPLKPAGDSGGRKHPAVY